jgi:Fe(3+) dicitrate transport protein
LRWHEDHEDRLQNREKFRMESGQMILTSVDPAGSQGNRVGSAEAFAAFVQDEIVMGRWTVMPGLRFEKIKTQRVDFASDDPDRSEGPTGLRQNHVDAVIPGIGANFQATDELTILAGVHRGFAPPGTSSRDGQASVEKSWSYELGLRYRREMLYLEVIGFYNDYGNILGNCTNASGCTGDIGDTYNGGEAEVKGIEAVMTYDIVLANGMTMPFAINYTYTDTKFNNSFEDGFWGDVLAGDEMPYIPEHQLHASLGIEAAKWGATLGMTYVGTIRTEAGQGTAPVMERVDDHVVFDLSAYYQLNETIRIFATADNLFDKKYAVARRPYGLRPGKPFSVGGGFSLGF